MNSLDLIRMRHVGYGLIQLCAHDTSRGQKTSLETQKKAPHALARPVRAGSAGNSGQARWFSHVCCTAANFCGIFLRISDEKMVTTRKSVIINIPPDRQEKRTRQAGGAVQVWGGKPPRLVKRAQIKIQGANDKYRQGESLAFFFCTSQQSEIARLKTLRDSMSCMQLHSYTDF